jgi:hypothetical protein
MLMRNPCSVILPALLLLGGCIEPLTVDVGQGEPELAVNETRRIELRYLRFDVEGFEETLTLEDLRALPQTTLDNV